MKNPDHWNSTYQSKSDADLSWTQAEPAMPLRLITEACASGRVIDVGGGTSLLAERLLDRGYQVTVLDIAEAALQRTRERLGDRASQIQWIAADICAEPRLQACNVWHDRAVFHFLTAAEDRAAYRRVLEQTVPIGGHVVMGTFALNGPLKCSGLDVQRYDASLLTAQLGSAFALCRSESEIHLTPQGKPQSFQYCVFRRI